MKRPVMLAVIFVLTSSAILTWLLLGDKYGQPAPGAIIRVAADPQLDGGRYIGFQSRNHSSAAVYMRRVGEATGLRFEYVPTSSRQDSYDKLLANDVDVVPTLLDVEQPVDSTRVAFSEPYYRGKTLILSRINGRHYSSLSELDGKLLAVKRGGDYEQWLRIHRPDVRLLTLNDVADILGAVESGVADAALGTDAIYGPLVRRDFSHSLTRSGSADELPVAVRVAVRRADSGLLKKLDDGLKMLAPAHHQKILASWLELAYRPAPSLGAMAHFYWLEVSLAAFAGIALVFALHQLRRSQRLAKRGELEKARILAVMTHEIRNAANSLFSAIDVLARGPRLTEQAPALDAAVFSSASLSLLLNNALEYSRLDAGHFLISPTPCSVVDIARECLRVFGPEAAEKGLRCELILPEGPLPHLMADPVLLRQILMNLISNAIKFTSEGLVEVSLYLEELQEDQLLLHLLVKDSGIGLSQKSIGELFRPFSQAAGGRSQGGAGLGLSICHDIVTRLGGKIDVLSVPGRWSRFQVEIPAKLAIGPVARNEDLIDSSPLIVAPDTRVLVVEDHLYSSRMLKMQLEAMGCEVSVAMNGAQALDLFVQAGPFCTVLLDCNLPDTDGYVLCRQMREIEQRTSGSSSQIIAISALSGKEHETRCMSSGFNQVMTKPLSQLQLQSHLARFARSHVVQDLPDIFWDLYSKDRATMEQAVTTKDWRTAANMAHRICGSAAFVGENTIEATSLDLTIGLRSLNADCDVLPDHLRALIGALHDINR
ncbi:ATP-binding protein [Stenotrophomonas sp. HMWF003]|uniref:ATP-binding protein n=1 Tax=Stenotrophomonas sp. HMWF003 TaxID=2056840 RepID=UPI000D493CA7|nr:ATP-binding protein [Stenotrophomonas sp. HMWF003]PTT64668.1 hypothetical protein DBR34_04135 [Stenotrophomonas sp. HMWF003]